MTVDDIKEIDQSGMYSVLVDFHAQVEDAVRIGKSTPVKLNVKGIDTIVLTGMGGSAMGGDLLRAFLSDKMTIPFLVNRHYDLPAFVNRDTLVIVSSYSGNTEETIAAHRDAIKRKARVLCLASGGRTEALAKEHRQQLVKIPAGFQPRAALGYLFFPLLMVLSRLGIVRPRPAGIRETIRLLKAKSLVYGDVASDDNLPLQLAHRLQGKLPVIYSPTGYFDAIGMRWRGQICENAKKLAFSHVLPEMSHNELVGWKIGAELMRQMEVIYLRDKGVHQRIALREDITREIIARYASHVTDVWSDGHSLLARKFSLIYFGDWVSFYLAILNKEDPTPVAVIQQLKGELAKV
ncbi:MAG: bifunctional phosphoglucose/phosphomannose isomerase [Ignavibacteria bacterium]|nr:bifunctional phosphoglucose/phosphomannose isomerase [Ignavibacteria bacterium]